MVIPNLATSVRLIRIHHEDSTKQLYRNIKPSVLDVLSVAAAVAVAEVAVAVAAVVMV